LISSVVQHFPDGMGGLEILLIQEQSKTVNLLHQVPP
jgi:hypothetical protein